MSEQVTLIYKRKGEDKPLQTWAIELVDWAGESETEVKTSHPMFMSVSPHKPYVEHYKGDTTTDVVLRGNANPLPECFFTPENGYEVLVSNGKVKARCDVAHCQYFDSPLVEHNTVIHIRSVCKNLTWSGL